MSDPNDLPYPPVAIVGTGRVAQSLGRAMAQSGWVPGAIAGRNPEHTQAAAEYVGAAAACIAELGRRFEHIIIAVNDDAIESVADALASTGLSAGSVLHTSGVKGPEALASLARRGVACASMHPLQTVVDRDSGPSALRSCYFALSGAAVGIQFAESVARCIGAKMFSVDPCARPLYHSAAVLVSNYVSGLLDAALTVLESIGMSREAALDAVRPLFDAAARNSASMGPEQALTGPILRGDIGTVQAHVRALTELEPGIAALYATVGRYVIGMAQRRGLGPGAASELAAVLRIPNA